METRGWKFLCSKQPLNNFSGIIHEKLMRMVWTAVIQLFPFINDLRYIFISDLNESLFLNIRTLRRIPLKILGQVITILSY